MPGHVTNHKVTTKHRRWRVSIQGHNEALLAERTQVYTPAADSVSGESQAGPAFGDQITPVIRERRIRWERQPRQPLTPLKDVKEWVGKQRDHENLPKKYQSVLKVSLYP